MTRPEEELDQQASQRPQESQQGRLELEEKRKHAASFWNRRAVAHSHRAAHAYTPDHLISPTHVPGLVKSCRVRCADRLARFATP